jgi:hypothetical protein
MTRGAGVSTARDGTHEREVEDREKWDTIKEQYGRER